MSKKVHWWLEKSWLFKRLTRSCTEFKLRRKFRKWKKQGSLLPMPDYGKQKAGIEYLKKYQNMIFVETGTYKGKMTYAVQPWVNVIHTIELDTRHFRNVTKRFDGIAKIHIYQGQSGQLLPEIIKKIDSPILFWLDAHYSAGSTAKADIETPILQELDAIFEHPLIDQHIILIDDARSFIGQHDYPTEQFLREYILSKRRDFVVTKKDDIFVSSRTHNLLNKEVEFNSAALN